MIAQQGMPKLPKAQDEEEQNPNEGQETSESAETYGTPKTSGTGDFSQSTMKPLDNGGASMPNPYDAGGITGGYQNWHPAGYDPTDPSKSGVNTPLPTGQASGYSLPTNWSTVDPGSYEGIIKGLYQSKGVQARPTSVPYWVGKVPELLARGRQLNPNGDGSDYLNKWLNNAEEFTGSAEATGRAMYGDSFGRGGGSIGGGGMSQWGGGMGSGPVQDAIMRLLQRGENGDVTPQMQAAFDAHQHAGDRATAQARAAMAERMAASGLNSGGAGSGAMDSAIQSQIEQQGLDQAQFESGAMLDEMQQRRQDVVNALQFAQGEEKMQLQAYLSQLDNELQKQQLGQQNQQFYDQFAYNQANNDRNYNLDYMRLMAGM